MDTQIIEQNSETLTTEKIQSLIYFVRDKQVMLDNELEIKQLESDYKRKEFEQKTEEIR